MSLSRSGGGWLPSLKYKECGVCIIVADLESIPFCNSALLSEGWDCRCREVSTRITLDVVVAAGLASLGYLSRPPRYSDAISRDSSSKATTVLIISLIHGEQAIRGVSNPPSGETIWGGFLHVMSMKFNRTPRLHSLLLFLQLLQSGVPSSHFRCLSLQVRHPVRTLLLLFGTGLGVEVVTVSAALWIGLLGLEIFFFALVGTGPIDGDIFCLLAGGRRKPSS